MKVIFLFILFFAIFFYACLDIESYSEIPEIHYKSFEIVKGIDDTTLKNQVYIGKLTFSFVDGDGNIGKHVPNFNDSLYKYKFDLYLTCYTKINGNYILNTSKIIDTTKNNNILIPYIEEKDGQNKTLMGDIIVEKNYYPALDTFLKDTFIYEYFIVDRDENQSNIDKTPDLYFNTDSIN